MDRMLGVQFNDCNYPDGNNVEAVRREFDGN
jgi:hypothetical protein